MISQRAINAMLRQQNKTSETQLQISTGRRVLSPADDPASATRVLGLNGALGRVQQYQDNASRAQSRLESEEGALIGATNLLQRAAELAVQGNNGTLSETDSKAVASEIRQLLDQLLSLANTQDSGGEYIFGGFQTGTKPFISQATGSYEYQGDLGQRRLQISPDRQVADGDNGYELFMNVATGKVAEVSGAAATVFTPIASGDIVIDGGNGNGPVSLGAIPAAANAGERAAQLATAINGQFVQTGIRATIGAGDNLILSQVGGTGIDIQLSNSATTDTTGFTAGNFPGSSGKRNMFETLHGLATGLEANQPVERYIADIQLALDNVISTHSGVGARMNSIEGQQEMNADLELSLQRHKSTEEDLDYAEAIARFERQMTALQAAQQTYVKIKGLSLFNYL
ncbi:MAG: flagellar hook-associated protein FlgL [Gammaproteobacteria bacterium]|nr:flagellar hook-associated protein FlgL [Gammaproteobacteria bacterium]